MNYEQIFHDASEALKAAAAALAPAAFGSTVAVLVKRGLTWTERFLQIAIGIVVSWHAQLAAIAIFAPDPFLSQAIGFTAGLLAYDALPRFRERAIALVVEIPDLIRERLAARKEGDK
jgi:hypothetical protein